MAVSKLSRWFGVLIFLAGAIVGAVTASSISSHLAGSNIVNNWVNSQTSYTQSHVLALRQLRTGETEQAIMMLEEQLNKDIVSLLPDRMDDFHITDQTKARVDQALRLAKDYRDEYPRESSGKLIEQEVEQAFSTLE